MRVSLAAGPGFRCWDSDGGPRLEARSLDDVDVGRTGPGSSRRLGSGRRGKARPHKQGY